MRPQQCPTPKALLPTTNRLHLDWKMRKEKKQCQIAYKRTWANQLDMYMYHNSLAKGKEDSRHTEQAEQAIYLIPTGW